MKRHENPADVRLRRIRAVQAMRRQLDLEDVEYRDLVARVSKLHGPEVRSAGDCNLAQLLAIGDELRKKIGKPAEKARSARVWAGKPKGDLSPQLSKIEALLADAGREWAYAHSLARRLCNGVALVEWCSPRDLAKIIAALQIDADRRARRAAAR